jgi:hypothetical protein
MSRYDIQINENSEQYTPPEKKKNKQSVLQQMQKLFNICLKVDKE